MMERAKRGCGSKFRCDDEFHEKKSIEPKIGEEMIPSESYLNQSMTFSNLNRSSKN